MYLRLLFVAVILVQQAPFSEATTEWADNGDVVHMAPTAFRRFRLKQKKSFVTLFYGKGDANIANVQREYAASSTAMAKTINLVAVDCGSNRRACKMFKVSQTPVVKWFTASLPVGMAVDMEPLEASGLINFLNLRIGSTPPPVPWTPENGKVVHLTASGFHRYRLETEDFLTLFYDKNCEHCKSMKPHYAQASIKGSEQIPFTAVDCTAHPKNQILCMRERVNQFPTLQIYEGAAKLDNTTGSLDLKTIFKVVRIVTGIEVEAPGWEKNGRVMHVTDGGFADFRAAHPEFLLMFYAPWCQHCKTFKPIYAEASDAAGDLFPFAAIDCTASPEVCSAEGVGGYPTLKLFEADGAGGRPYEFGQSVNELVEFAQLRSGKAPEPPPEWEKNVNVEHLDSFRFSAFADSHDQFFALFYAPSCAACIGLKHDYAEASRTAPLPMAAIDCERSASLCAKFDVKSMPRLIFVRDSIDAELGDGEDYAATHKATSYVRYLQTKAGTLSRADWLAAERAESVANHGLSKWFPQQPAIVGVGEFDFDIFRLENDKAFVFFYAPWCAHCKETRPEFKYSAKWAKEFAPQVAYAAVDCSENQHFCREQGITGYPTLKLYRNAEDTSGFKYTESDRTESKFNEFVAFFATDKPDPGYEPVAWEQNGAVIHLTDYSFDEFQDENDQFLLMFYAPWCDASQRLIPLFSDASFEALDAMPFAAVDCVLARDLCGKHTLNTFPQIYHFSDGVGRPERLRSEDEIVKFARMKTGTIRPEDELPGWKSNGAVHHLSDMNFDGFATEHRQFMVFFYAPWCGHCQRAKPEFAAASLLVEELVPMAAVNCEEFRDTCGRFQVKGFPTIKMVIDAKDDETYTGARTSAALADFLRGRVARAEGSGGVEWKHMGRVPLFVTDRTFSRYLADSSDMGVMAYFYDQDSANAVQGLPYIRHVGEYTHRFCPIVALNCAGATERCGGDHGAKPGDIVMFQNEDSVGTFDGIKTAVNIVRWALTLVGMEEEEFKMKYTTFEGKGLMEDKYNTITRIPIDEAHGRREEEEEL